MELTEEEKMNRMRALHAAKHAARSDCRCTFKPVEGTTAYLRCPKCGKRCDAD